MSKHECNATTWKFNCNGDLRWLDAHCSCCHTSSVEGNISTLKIPFVHCGKRELCTDAAVIAAFNAWTPNSAPPGAVRWIPNE